MSAFRLGRRALKTDSRTLRLGKYLGAQLPAPPAAVDWTESTTEWGAMLNDSLGDCTIAGCGHAIQVWTLNTGTEITLPDQDIESIYEHWCGYNPDDPSTDQGGIELDVLNNWRQKSFYGHKLLGFADPNVANLLEVKQAIALFGGCYIGLQVPNSIMAAAVIPEVWDVAPNDEGIAGGHCVYVVGYDANSFTFISWGSIYRMTYSFWTRYVDEAHALLSPDWIASTQLAASGFNLTQLQADLALIV